MGKKSRLKRERRLRKAQKPVDFYRVQHEVDNNDLVNQVSVLKKLFAQYNAEDVLVSLGVSDLWLPNISSIVKHYFAIGTFLSMDPAQFNSESKIDSYGAFKSFIEQTQSLLPSFPMLEDYVPETDWGDVKVLLNEKYFRIFYGGTVERIPDFIEAFRLLHFSPNKCDQPSSISTPLDDLSAALQLQHNILSAVENPYEGMELNISPGHIEVPNHNFWLQCSKALRQTIPKTKASISLSSKLLLTQGSFQMPDSIAIFSEKILSGSFIPAIFAEVSEHLFPISPRNAAEKVIECWSGLSFYKEDVLIDNMANFISQRFRVHNLIVGPCSLATKNERIPVQFSAVILGLKKAYLVCTLDVSLFDCLPRFENDIKLKLSGADGDYYFIHDQSRQAFQLNERYTPNNIELIVILPRVSLQLSVLPIPDGSNARVLALPDFVTIVDSLENNLEIEKFWSFVDSQTTICGPMAGVSDYFGAYRDSAGLLVDGAITPTMVTLDPHWGSNWRYKELVEFWTNSPEMFPTDLCTAWKVDSPETNGIQQLASKNSHTFAWHVKVGDCFIFFLFEFHKHELDETNDKLLELFMHCIADALAQQKLILKDEAVFNYRRIVITCTANSKRLIQIGSSTSQQRPDDEIISQMLIVSEKDNSEISLALEINLDCVQSGLIKPVDASFEMLCLREWLENLYSTLDLKLNENIISKTLKMSTRPARFALSIEDKMIDLPDHVSPLVPHDSHYKLARREMAKLFMATGAEPGRYELAEAKTLIDQVKNASRQVIHERISEVDRASLLIFCIEQYDALVTDFIRKSANIHLSLSHEVSYDRSARLSELHTNFTQQARNYRYMLECCLSSTSSSARQFTEDDTVELVAFIDWLFVLYGASDTLHNDIDIGGVELDQFFIPEVFYSQHLDKQEQKFGEESANYRLGLGLESNDTVNSLQADYRNWDELDDAFLLDAGFSLTDFITVLVFLSQWQSHHGKKECYLSYVASAQTIVESLVDKVDDLPTEKAQKIIAFLTLDPESIRQLIGKDIYESDVPVWEHNKRGSRYTIRPLVPINGTLHWGAGAVERSFRVWTGSISEGYLPADFQWPKVKGVIRKIKKGIEQQLEVKAYEICARTAPHVVPNVDFKSRFPKEHFDDVGDFDVLAYWPDRNQWLIVECKYNQPPFCIKDTRRLRERIFGRNTSRGQISKIERRQEFLESNVDKIRILLNWPEPEESIDTSISAVYVSKDIYWWMRHPPYEVTCEFVRVDALDSWLQSSAFNVNNSKETSVISSKEE